MGFEVANAPEVDCPRPLEQGDRPAATAWDAVNEVLRRESCLLTDSHVRRKAVRRSALSPIERPVRALGWNRRAEWQVRFGRRGEPHGRAASMYALPGTMDGHWEDEGDGLHELIARSLRHRQTLWELVLSMYRVELTQLLDYAAKNECAPVDRDLVIDVASRIAVVALEAELQSVRSDALSLRSYADTEPFCESGERRVLIAGLKLIDRILEIERARRNAEPSSSPSRPN